MGWAMRRPTMRQRPMPRPAHQLPVRHGLVLDDGHDAGERSADRLARQAISATPGRLSRSIAGLEARLGRPAPASVPAVVTGPGRPLDPETRGEAERRYGQDFSAVRVHTGGDADRSARDVDARAYAVGNHVVFGAGGYAPATPRGGYLLAHELAHVVQGTPGVVHRYRAAGSMAFGELDTSTLVEQSFSLRTDKETKPWIELITVEFSGTSTDSDGNTFWTGSATARYYRNPAQWADLTFTVAGGSRELGRTDAGSFTVSRIEGVGYNSGTASGRAGVDFKWSDRESGANWHYTKKDAAGDRPANMSFAVFYHGGEALHAGPLDYSSHGCVHVDFGPIQQVNYHSVVGLTKVKVSYPKKP